MRELNSLVGLADVKRTFEALISSMAVAYAEDKHGHPQTSAGLLNRVFQGPPGTGKTTIAKLYARLLYACGFLSKGDCVLTKPADFKGAAIGGSEAKVAAKLELALGGVLVIDEAYGLAADDAFVKSAVDMLVAETPDRGARAPAPRGRRVALL